MKALLGPLYGSGRVEGEERGAGLREDPEAVENDDAVIPLGYIGESGSGGGCGREVGARSWCGCDGSREAG